MKTLLTFLGALTFIATLSAKDFDATYTATISNIPPDAKELTVWLPLPITRGPQRVREVAIDAPYRLRRMTEHEFGNEYAVATIPGPIVGDLTFKVHFVVSRDEETLTRPPETDAPRHSLTEPALAPLH